VVYNENGVKLYFGKDHEFLRPKGVIGFKILFPKETMSVKHKVYSRLYVACVNESLNELSYPAKQAGLNYSIREGYEGIYIDVNGYKESSMALFELLLDHMVDFSITENKFLAIKDKVVRDYKNFALSDAHQQTREKAPDILYHVKYTWEESLPVAESASLNGIKDYSKSLYEKTYTEAMVYGDFEKTDAEKTARIFREKTKTKGIHREEAFDLKYLKLDEPEIIQYTDNLLVNNSCFFRQYVLGEDSPQIRAVSKIIDKAVQQPFFTEMRTNQQLGYIVGSYTNNLDETHYLNFLIQSGVYPADELNRRADEFIMSSAEILNSMDSETFQQLVDSVIEELEKTPMSIAERARKLKTYIFEHDADYLRDQDTIESLSTIDKETVANLLDSTVSPKSRRMVNVLTFAENHDNITKVKSSFSNLDTWKASRVYE
jgi:insulysin